MISTVLAFLLATLLGATLTAFVRKVSSRIGLVDLPGIRRVQTIPIPRSGGIAIAIAFLAPITGIFLFRTGVAHIFQSNHAIGIFVGAILMTMVGVFDDLRGLGAKRKIFWQVVIASYCYLMGFQIGAVVLPGIGRLEMGFFSYFVSVLWIIGIVNAFNLLDGLDGLAAGVGIIVLATNFILGYSMNAVVLCFLIASLAGALLGFLVFNFNPASIFMGDSGSMLIGFVLATTSLMSNQKGSTVIAILVPVIALGVPIFDTLLTMVRRYLERRPIFAPDRGHIHHRLIAMGLTHRRAVLLLYAVSIVLALIALAIHFGKDWQVGLALAAMVAFVVFMTRYVYAIRPTADRGSRKFPRTERTERIRRNLNEALQRMDDAVDSKDFEQSLHWFLSLCQFHRFHIRLEKGEYLYEWVNDSLSTPHRVPKLCLEFAIQSQSDHSAVAVFIWYSERGRPSPQTDILLQVWLDHAERRLGELHSVKHKQGSA